MRHYHLTYPNLRDNDGAFAHSYGTDQLPESFVIDRQGHIVAISRGEIDQAFLDRAIALAQAARESAADALALLRRRWSSPARRPARPRHAVGRRAPAASLPVIERQVMCVTCKIPLNVAQSPQADRERAFIQRLIDEGETEAQIKNARWSASTARRCSACRARTASTWPPTSCRSRRCSRCSPRSALLLPRWRRRARAQGSRAPTPRLDPPTPPAGASADAAAARPSDLARPRPDPSVPASHIGATSPPARSPRAAPGSARSCARRHAQRDPQRLDRPRARRRPRGSRGRRP